MPLFKKKSTSQIEPLSEQSTLEMLLAPNRSKDEFVLLYCKLVEERSPNCKLTLEGPTVIHLQWESGEESMTFLDNLWIQTRGGGESHRDLVERHLRMVLATGQSDPPIEQRQIVPIIKDSTYVGMSKGLLHDHLVADIYVVFAIDLEDRIKGLSVDEADSLGMSVASRLTIAIENLTAILPPIECHGEGPWFLLTAGGDYTASVLLLDSVWDQLSERVQGDIVAAVPSRDVLLFTGSNSKEGLAAVREKAAEISKTGDHVIANTLIRRRDGKWVAFD